MIEKTVAEMYRAEQDNRFLEVTYQNGDKEILYFKDFSSGAMIENIVRRAKKLAIKRAIAGAGRGIRLNDMLESIKQEYKENEDLPEHDEPRRLGEDLRQEGRADRLRPHADRPGRGRPGRPGDRAGGDRPVPLAVPVARWFTRTGCHGSSRSTTAGGSAARVRVMTQRGTTPTRAAVASESWPSPRCAGSRPSTACSSSRTRR